MKQRVFLFVVGLACALCLLGQGTGSQTGTLSGVVTTSNGQPLSRAKVTLSADPSSIFVAAGPTSAGKSTIADDNGKYTFQDVSPGVYLVSADAPGFARQAYGGKPGYFGSYNGRVLPLAATPVTVTGNDRISGVNIQLMRFGALAGRVTTGKNDPVSAIPVYAVRWTYLDGNRRLLEKGRAETNVRGEFRIEGLAPGQYYLYAVPPVTKDRSGKAIRSKLPTFSPNALVYREAIAVTLAAGADGFGDIRLREDAKVAIRGTVVGSQRGQVSEGAVVLLMEDPDTPIAGGVVGTPGPTPPPATQSYSVITFTDTNGGFLLEGVTPGRHRLIALGGKNPTLNMSTEEGRRWMRPGTKEAPGPGEGSMGSTELVVGDQNVEGVAILLHPGGEITSKIGMDGKSYRDWTQDLLEKRFNNSVPAAQKAKMLDRLPQVTLIPEAAVAVGGNFPNTSEGQKQKVSPGRYFLSIPGVNQLYYVKSIRLGGTDVTRKPFDFRGGIVDMEITLGTDGGRVTGSTTDHDGNVIRGAPVALWPAISDQTLRNGGALTVNSKHDGSFAFPLVPPGEYYAIAFEDLPDPGLAQYPAFVSKFSGKRIKVEPNQGISAVLEAITAREVERVVANLQ